MSTHIHRVTMPWLFLILAAPLCGLNAPPELEPLSAEVQNFASSEKPSAQESRRLLHQIHLTETTYENPIFKDLAAAGRSSLAALRAQIAATGKAASPSLKAAATLVAETGTLRGRVLGPQAVAVAGSNVEIYSLEGYYVQSTSTDFEGRYSLDLPPASYFVYANPGFLSPQVHSGLNCPIYLCDLAEATPVAIVAGNSVTVDFQLIPLGAVEGRVLRFEDGTPLQNGSVGVFDVFGYQLISSPIVDGTYHIDGLNTGTYYVGARNFGDRIGMVYPNTLCPTGPFDYQLRCNLFEATAVSVVAGATTSGIDLVLKKGATVEGRVLSKSTQTPVAANVTVFDTYRRWSASTVPDNDGNYRIEGISPGQSWVYAESSSMTSQLYPSFDCPNIPNCLSSVQPLDFQLGELRTGIDFELKGRGTVTGRVTEEASGTPISEAYVELTPIGSPNIWSTVRTDSAGHYSFSNVPAVRYSVHVIAANHVDEYFDDVDARRGVAAATPIQIEPQQVLSGIDFQLKRTGFLKARILSAETGLPVFNCSGFAIPAGNQGGGTAVGSCQPDGSLTIENLDSGLYYLQVEAYGSVETASYLHGSGSCNPDPTTFLCDLSRGTLIQIQSGQETGVFEIRLERAAQIFLQASLAGNNAPTGQVRLFEELTEIYSQALWGPSQTYHFPHLKPGRYRLVAEGAPNWQNVTLSGQICNRWYCDPRDSSVLELGAGETAQLSLTLHPLDPYLRCFGTEESLCLNQGRFQVRAFWKDFLGHTGPGIARKITDETGYFYFFSPNNIEVMIKMLNGCTDRLGHRFWAFAAGLTNVEVELEITDTLTGRVERYRNGLGQTYQPILDIDAFATCDTDEPTSASPLGVALADRHEPSTPVAVPRVDVMENDNATSTTCWPASGTEFCVGGRFRTSVSWRTPRGESGLGYGFAITEDTAAVSFFSQNNIEVMIKILDACHTGLPGYWVFASGLTDVEIDLRIEDVQTGRVKVYHQPAGPFQPILDLGTFACN